MTTIRRARVGEAAELTDLAIRSKAVWGYDDELMSQFEQELQISAEHIRSGQCFVLLDDAAVCAFYLLKSIEPGIIELDHLFVSPEQMKKGYGSLLLQHAQLTARANQCRTFTIQSDPNSVGFYERHGIEVVKEVPSSVPGRRLPFLECRFEPPKLTKDVHTAFSDAIQTGCVPTSTSLITRHPELVNHPNWTPPPLHCAVLWNQPEIAELLLNFGADLEMRDPDRQTTPLRYAVMYCKPDLIRVLHLNGANTGSIETGGTSALELAKQAAAGAFEEYDDLPRPDAYAEIVSTLQDCGVHE